MGQRKKKSLLQIRYQNLWDVVKETFWWGRQLFSKKFDLNVKEWQGKNIQRNKLKNQKQKEKEELMIHVWSNVL